MRQHNHCYDGISQLKLAIYPALPPLTDLLCLGSSVAVTLGKIKLTSTALFVSVLTAGTSRQIW